MRNTAASQLADVQKAHPHELFNLLNRIVPYLRSRHWDTRIAAIKAIAGIVENAEKWDPNSLDDPANPEETEGEGEDEGDEGMGKGISGAPLPKPENEQSTAGPDDLLSFDTLDIATVIKKGKRLLGSSGKEYDYSLADLDPAERLAAQKKNVTARLGLGGEYIEDEIVTERDFAVGHTAQTPRIDTSVGGAFRQPMGSPALQSAMSPRSGIPGTPGEDGAAGLSRRQQNALKRKKKLDAKNQANKVRVVDLGGSSGRKMSIDVPQTPVESTPQPIKQESNGVTDYFSLDTKNPPDESKIAVEFKGPQAPPSPIIQTSGEGFEWPFERLCEILLVDMFDPNWEIRHGAAMGLREVVRVHGAGAGRERGKSRKENNALNRKWLDDLACRLCCIFMLDRFGDYVSDTVRFIPICSAVSLDADFFRFFLSYRSLLQFVRQPLKQWARC